MALSHALTAKAARSILRLHRYMPAAGMSWEGLNVVRRLRQLSKLTVLLSASITLASWPMGANAGLYYEGATSGTGTTTGTAAIVTTWSSWAVPENPSHPCAYSPPWCALAANGNPGWGYTDEAIWLIHGTTNNDLEAGFGSGWAVGVNGGWTNAMEPYYTTGNGATEVNATSAYNLPAATPIWMAMITNGTTSALQVNNWPQSINYGVASSRTNFAQYETAYGDDWMGGGVAPSVMHMYFQPASSYPSGWSNWGIMSCDPADYSATGAAFNYANACNVGSVAYQWDGYGYGNGLAGS